MDVQRESMEVDVLIVGAGPAGLAAAIHLTDLIEQAREAGSLKGAAAGDEFMLMVIDKGAEVGDHMLSGAVLDPRGLDELIPEWRDGDSPVKVRVEEEAMFYLTRTGRMHIPWTPPALDNHGMFIISLQQLAKWMNGVLAAKGVDVFSGMAGAAPVLENGRLTGIITDDKGLDKEGKPKSNFEPGVILNPKVTILAEGPRGSLTKQVVPALDLDKGRNPQSYLTGVKELWEIPKGRIKQGTVYHTLGFPLGMKHYGGSWVYAMSDELLSIGLASALAYEDPRFDPHGAFQEFKTHPWVTSLLKGGKMTKYGAKTISEGGYWAVPQPYHDGLLLVGECAGFLNSMRLKGIHLAIKSGMLAARAAFKALQNEDYSAGTLAEYDRLYRESWLHDELWRVRNFHQGFRNGMFSGMWHTAAQLLSGGRGFTSRLGGKPDHLHMKRLSDLRQARQPVERKFDGELTFDKLTDVYASGTKHEENQPPHLKVADTDICSGRCSVEYGNPCQYFCPAEVYEMVDRAEGGKALQINASNCVHCKTCDIADPYGIITWVPPEGGGGPVYTGM